MGRPPMKKIEIQNGICQDIVSGVLPPGARVPTRRAIALRYNATLKTVQQALHSLELDGFVVSAVGNGTYVADKPPHLNEFALVFPGPESMGLFWGHLADAARWVIKEQGFKLKIFTGIDKTHPGEDYQRLMEDVQHSRLAGIIFATAMYIVSGTEIVEKPGIPRVMVSGPPENPNLGSINFDSQSFASKAAKYLLEKNIKTTGILGQPGLKNELLIKELDKAGIDCPYHMQHEVNLGQADLAKGVMRLMFDQGNANRPQALIIRDDNLFNPALAGILDTGLRIPQDLVIITHSNFPWQEQCPVPVIRLGYDLIEMLKVSMAELESQRQGNPPQEINFPAVFENELPKSTLQIK